MDYLKYVPKLKSLKNSLCGEMVAASIWMIVSEFEK